MLKQLFKNLTSLVLVLVCLFTFATPTFAASGTKDDPYGYTWIDESSGTWYFQYYNVPNGKKVYSVVDYVYLKGNILYASNSKIISKNVRSMDANPNLDTKPTVAFYNGNLYFITTNGELCKMTTSTAKTYSKANQELSAKYFTLDANALGSKIGTKKLSSMSFNGSYATSSTTPSVTVPNTTNKKGNFILTYAYPGDPLKVCYDAYKDDKLLLSVYCKNANVWLETEQLLLSETCVGAKFVGFSHNYHTILYDQDGTVYAFAYGNYKKALPISLGEEIMSYKKDDKGFVESITTSKKTYNLDSLLKEYDEDDFVWVNDLKSVTNSTNKSVLYNKNEKVVATLKKSNKNLYYENIKLPESYNPTYFGFTQSGNAVWINNASELYYINTDTKVIYLVKDSVSRLRYDDNGFAYQYKVGNKTYAIDF